MIAHRFNGLVVGSVYALFALGFTLIFGVHHILNMAHGAVFMWGAFFGLFAVTRLDLPFPLGFVIAIVLAGLLSVALDWVAFRPLRKRSAPEFSAIVSSIGASLVLMNIAQRVSDTRVLRYPFGTLPVDIYTLFGLRITLIQALMVVSAAVIVSALFIYLFYTRFGRQIRAVAMNERTATLLGVNPDFVYFQTFFISGALAGAAGVLIGIAFNSVHFLMGDAYMLRAFVVIVLGGLGSIMGALIAGLLLGLVQTLTIAYVSSGLSDAIIFSILFVALLLRPTGFSAPCGRNGGWCANDRFRAQLSSALQSRHPQLRAGAEPICRIARRCFLSGDGGSCVDRRLYGGTPDRSCRRSGAGCGVRQCVDRHDRGLNPVGPAGASPRRLSGDRHRCHGANHPVGCALR